MLTPTVCTGCGVAEDPVTGPYSTHVGCCDHASPEPGTTATGHDDPSNPYCADCGAALVWEADHDGGGWMVR